MNDSVTDGETSACIKPRVDQTILNTRTQTPKLINVTSNAGIFTFQGISIEIPLLL